MLDPQQPRESKIVCVMGMHRSGTSLVAGILNAMGVFMGREQSFAPKRPDNPGGFWEIGEIWRANDDILAAMGGAWDEPPLLPPGWELGADLAPIVDSARRLVAKEFGGKPLWGWKDPRTCLTLRFWQRLITPTHYVICLRNPIDVWNSLVTRNGYSLDEASALWFEYVASALDNTSNQNRLLIWYEDLMSNPKLEVERLRAFIGAGTAGGSSRIDAELLIQPSLRHYCTAACDVEAHPDLPPSTRKLYSLIRSAAAGIGSGGSEAAIAAEAAQELQHLLREKVSPGSGHADATARRAAGPLAAADQKNTIQITWSCGDQLSDNACVSSKVVADWLPHRYLMEIGTFLGALRIGPGYRPAYWRIRYVRLYADLDSLYLGKPSLECAAHNQFEGLSIERGALVMNQAQTYDFLCQDAEPRLLLDVKEHRSHCLAVEMEISVLNLNTELPGLASRLRELERLSASLRGELSELKHEAESTRARFSAEREGLTRLLAERDEALKRIKATTSWKVFERYGRVKHAYILPALRALRLLPRPRSDASETECPDQP